VSGVGSCHNTQYPTDFIFVPTGLFGKDEIADDDEELNRKRWFRRIGDAAWTFVLHFHYYPASSIQHPASNT
jgi:hypothetical protein